MTDNPKGATPAEPIAQPAPEPDEALTTCNCRWRGEEVVQQCTLHEAWEGAIHEWAARAKEAERRLAEDGWTAPDFRKAWQGGLTNEELEQWWRLKLPNVEAKNRDICVFALGVEVGAGMGLAPKPDAAMAATQAQPATHAEVLTGASRGSRGKDES